MKQITVEVSPRETTGSSNSRRLRAAGKIPVVIYAHEIEAIPSAIDAREFTKAASQSRSSQIFSIKSSDSRINGRSALVKEIQKDNLKDSVLHVDFFAIRDDEKVTVEIPLKFVGESVGVKTDGGLLSVSTHVLEVSCFPKSIPEELVIDISGLGINDSIHAGQIQLPEGVELTGEEDEVIVGVVIAKVMETAIAAPAEAAADAAAPAEGAAAATPAAATPEAGAEKAEKEKK